MNATWLYVELALFVLVVTASTVNMLRYCAGIRKDVREFRAELQRDREQYRSERLENR